ncbi:Thaumatin-2 precursor, putative [Ricinus communis]|uniref:Thaumatin-2, putative n=1 Tax=Ricinus communis TaxID=3988 RepID=B9RM54_RICCO|nr:Thaumatin-2 precursor, putative [Ricinus communis]
MPSITNFSFPFVIQTLRIIATGADAAVFSISNRCNFTIWPGILAGAGKAQLMDGGFELEPGYSVNIQAPQGWSGRFWARIGCKFGSFGQGSCVTGDCGGLLRCGGAGGQPPASLAEFTVDSPIDY